MKKILTSVNMRGWDAYTIANEPIASIELMERAAGKCFDWLVENFNHTHHFLICCGTGNNGGDGLVIARLLDHAGYDVHVYFPMFDLNILSADARGNFERLNPLLIINENLFFENLKNKNTVVVDALFGTGLNKEVTDAYAKCIEQINQSTATIVSIDIPSGLFCDSATPNDSSKIKADYTLTFQSLKPSFVLPQTAAYCGKVIVLDILLLPQYYHNVETIYFTLEENDIVGFLKPRSPFSHKGTYGHALLIGGSYGKAGAIILAATACMRSGVGLTSIITDPECIIPIQSSISEAMCIINGYEKIVVDGTVDSYDVIGIGPGLNICDSTIKIVEHIFKNYSKQIVVDADGINLISANKFLLECIPPNVISTPHPKELQRLIGTWNDDFEKLEMTISFCKKYNCFCVIKGNHSCIVNPEGQIVFNTTGNAGMATGGSGDVLTGIISAFAAQGYEAYQSLMLGVFMHGLAGDFAAAKYSQWSMIASDIISCLPMAFEKISAHNNDKLLR